MTRKTYLTVLATALAVLWVALAIAPLHRSDWLLENVLLLVGIGVLVGTYRIFPLSRISYTALFVFFCLHMIGAHYTYSEVPYEAATRRREGSGSACSAFRTWSRGPTCATIAPSRSHCNGVP